MAKKEFILQGFTPRTHVKAVNDLFDVSDIQRVVLSVAFVTEGGVDLLAASLKACAGKVTIFAGVRNDLTSRQGLGRLHALGVTLYAVDTGSRNVVFHPKIYLVRGHSRARVVLGSANLTIGGLNNNIEASLTFDFDLSVKGDKAVVDAIEEQFDALPTDHPLNVLKIRSTAQLNNMKASGRLVDEMATPPPRPGTTVTGGSGDGVPRIVLKVPPLRKALKAAKKPAAAKSGTPAATPKGKAVASVPASPTVGVELEPVWESKPLTERDLNIPKGTNTNKTGNMNLDQGLLPDGVDFRHYFRDSVFALLEWTPSTRKGSENRELAQTQFALVIKGVSYGDHELTISHSTSTTSKTYLQKNASTNLRWGPIKELVATSELLNRTLYMFRDKADPTRFMLEID
jgi:HKD family nuclease